MATSTSTYAFEYQKGNISSTQTIEKIHMTISKAKTYALKLHNCIGFCIESAKQPTESKEFLIHFKEGESSVMDIGKWHTYLCPKNVFMEEKDEKDEEKDNIPKSAKDLIKIMKDSLKANSKIFPSNKISHEEIMRLDVNGNEEYFQLLDDTVVNIYKKQLQTNTYLLATQWVFYLAVTRLSGEEFNKLSNDTFNKVKEILIKSKGIFTKKEKEFAKSLLAFGRFGEMEFTQQEDTICGDENDWNQCVLLIYKQISENILKTDLQPLLYECFDSLKKSKLLTLTLNDKYKCTQTINGQRNIMSDIVDKWYKFHYNEYAMFADISECDTQITVEMLKKNAKLIEYKATNICVNQTKQYAVVEIPANNWDKIENDMNDEWQIDIGINNLMFRLEELKDHLSEKGVNIMKEWLMDNYKFDITRYSGSFTNPENGLMHMHSCVSTYCGFIANELKLSYDILMNELFEKNRLNMGLNVNKNVIDEDLGYSAAPVKSLGRSLTKLSEDYYNDSEPKIYSVQDWLRGAIVVENDIELINLFELICKEFSGKVTRIKNAFCLDASKTSYGYRAVLMNMIYEHPNKNMVKKGFKQVVEIQLILLPYLKARHKMHLYYKICRANKMGDMALDFTKAVDSKFI